MKKKMLGITLAALIGAMSLTPAINTKAAWSADNAGWWWTEGTGYVTNDWRYVNGSWYWFDGSGYMATGWRNIGGAWYYLRESGAMATGWANVNGTWYYLRESGAMATGWANVNGTWYYLRESGAMATGWVNVNGTWYYLRESGAMATGWVNVNGTWYYLYESGAMATGWTKVSGTWYYLDGSGAMQTGWVKEGNSWYYLYPDGAMAANTHVGKDYVNASGVWVSENNASEPDGVSNAGNQENPDGDAGDSSGNTTGNKDNAPTKQGWNQLEDGRWYFIREDGSRIQGPIYVLEDGTEYQAYTKTLRGDGQVVTTYHMEIDGTVWFLDKDGYTPKVNSNGWTSLLGDGERSLNLNLNEYGAIIGVW